ncbi:Chaperone protein HtpG [Aquisphaera giovannonii]|uniref:Chaperone protein HtpG n=1 Tax=Aquisphaera giovannonii TaxID=406548 RepID=A0A5B9WAX7_9BACT|nr:ATP-binding protein [Aquisphaera giovannonii]QEH37818.1 Chaperone protein HtpG [Aquisphaera giovannonii]
MPDWSRRIPFKVDVAGVIQIMGTSLYSRAEAAFRELLQNAHDAVVRRRRGDLSYKGRIDVVADPESQTITIRDDGIGLSPEEAEKYLGTLGIGITGMLRRRAGNPDPTPAKDNDEDLIGQFGIGLFSAFMLADRVVVESRRDGSEAVRWSAGDGPDIELCSSEKAEPGTTVTLHLKPQYAALVADASRIEAAVKEYADFLPVPIHLNGAGPRTNLIDAAWFAATPDVEAIEQEILTYFDESPLHVIPIRVETPTPIAGALYVTPRRTPGFAGEPVLTTTIRRMVISRRTAGLLPEWAIFIRGVLELSGCSPTASREDLARDASFQQAREALEEILLAHFESLAGSDPQRLQALLAWHRYSWAGAALGHARLRNLLRRSYQFTTSVGSMTFEEVLGRSRPDGLLDAEYDRLIWYNTDRRQERWVNELFDGQESPCVHALRGFEESLLVMMAADATAAGTATDLRIASPGSRGFGEQVLGLADLEPAPERWQAFLESSGAKILVATFRSGQPVMAFLNEKHDLARAFDDLGKQGTVPPGFQRLIEAQLGGEETPRNEVILNRGHDLVSRALDQKTTMPLASVLRLLVHNALTTAGAALPRAAQREQADDLGWIADCLKGKPG